KSHGFVQLPCDCHSSQAAVRKVCQLDTLFDDVTCIIYDVLLYCHLSERRPSILARFSMKVNDHVAPTRKITTSTIKMSISQPTGRKAGQPLGKSNWRMASRPRVSGISEAAPPTKPPSVRMGK